MTRNAYTPCDFEGCQNSPHTGHILWRVNEKGVPGIFMCDTHAKISLTARRERDATS